MVCGMNESDGGVVKDSVPIFLPTPPTLFVNILYIFFCSWKSPHKIDRFTCKETLF